MDIPIAKTIFTEKELDVITRPLKSGWVVQGPFVKEFEEKWSLFTGAKYSIATSNCTTAIHLSLAALEIGQGDEVIVPAFTWIATANAVEAVGARPVFCDVSLKTFNIDVSLIDDLVTDKTKAIIPVHLFGSAADMKSIVAISKKYNIQIIEDAACGFAARYKGIHLGNFGISGCFSFHPRKAITTGEGGMITTNDEAFAKKLRAMRDHGATISDFQRHFGARPYLLPEFPYLGFNYRMTDIQAAIGSSQMDRAEDIYLKRKNLAERYDSFCETIPWLKKPYRDKNSTHGFQSYVCLFEAEKICWNTVEKINHQRNDFMDYLQKNGISTRPGTHAVHALKYYREKYNINKEDFPNSYFADQCSIAFPLFPSLATKELDYIFSTIQQYNI